VTPIPPPRGGRRAPLFVALPHVSRQEKRTTTYLILAALVLFCLALVALLARAANQQAGLPDAPWRPGPATPA